MEAIVKYVHQIKCENDRNIRMRLPSQGLKHIVLVGNPGKLKQKCPNDCIVILCISTLLIPQVSSCTYYNIKY